jgi:hypothetical protein
LTWVQGNGRFKGFIGTGLGAHFSSRSRYLNGAEFSPSTDAGLVVNVPIGVYLVATEKVYVMGGYVFNYLSNSFFENDIMHQFALGVLFVLE